MLFPVWQVCGGEGLVVESSLLSSVLPSDITWPCGLLLPGWAPGAQGATSGLKGGVPPFSDFSDVRGGTDSGRLFCEGGPLL